MPVHRTSVPLALGLLARGSVGLAILASACTFDGNYDGTRFRCEQDCPDGYECVDGQCEPIDRQRDASVITAVDSGSPDGEVPDAARSADAGSPPDAAQLTCDEQFGAAPGYELCLEKEPFCSFFVQVGDTESCERLCADLGATCFSTFNASPGAPCEPQDEDDCLSLHTTQICTCVQQPPPA